MQRAQFCNFGDMAERMVRDKIVFTVKGQAQELLMRERNLTLKENCWNHVISRNIYNTNA